MTTFDYYRVLVVLLPALLLAWLFVYRDRNSRQWSGYLLAYVWQFQMRLLLLAGAINLGLVQYQYDVTVAGVNFYQVPVDAMIGCSLLFGPLAAIFANRISPVFIAVFDFAWQLFWLPFLWTGVTVSSILLIAILAIVPSLYLASWTMQDRHIYLRATLQPLAWAIALLWLLPSMLLQATGGDWSALWNRPGWLSLLMLAPLMLPAAIIGSALYEFAVRGKGTAFPYDPPKHLVTSGVYRYVSNPMQIGIVLLMFWWGVVLESVIVSATGAVAVMLFIAFKDVCNGSCQLGQTDPRWRIYQQQVRRWWPRKPGRPFS